MTSPRVLFAGTPDFALASLEALTDAGLEPVAVFTQPDRPAGRGKRLTASPVKRFADRRGIEVLQPATLRDDAAAAAIAGFRADVMIVAAYGLILPQRVLDIPGRGCLNVHASLLPRWRGAAPVQAAILAGDRETGISLMSMTAGLDCGPVYATAAIGIGSDESAGVLGERLARLGGRLLVRELEAILEGSREAIAQDESLATYAPKITTADARIDWTMTADDVLRRVRAWDPVPGAWFMLGDERIKCWRATKAEGMGAPPGRVLEAAASGVVVACADAAVALRELQRPGRRRVDAAQFAAGFDIAGRTLG